MTVVVIVINLRDGQAETRGGVTECGWKHVSAQTFWFFVAMTKEQEQ